MFDRSDYVRVKNGTDGVIKGRWDGRDYVWKSGQHIDIPLVVARHIFAFDGNETEQMAAFSRLGWTRTNNDLESARERFALLSFTDCPELVEREIGDARERPLVAGGDSRGGRPVLPSPDEPLADGETL